MRSPACTRRVGARDEAVALRERSREERRALVGEEGGEGGVAHRAPAEVAAERALGQGIDAQHAHGLPVEVEGGHDAFDHGRARAQAVLDPEEAIDVLGQAARTPAHLVGGAARDGLGAAGEAAAGGLVREVDGHHHGHPEGDPQDHEAVCSGRRTRSRRPVRRRVGEITAPPLAGRRPPSMVSTRSARAATSALWVTSRSVLPARRVTESSRSRTAAPVASSRLPVGSSASTSRGSRTSARAMATRCCSPPESRSGKLRARSSRPTRARSSRARAAGPADRGQLRGQQHVLEHGQGGDEVEELEHEAHVVAAEERARGRGRVAGGSVPSTITSPALGWSMPATRFKTVLLPLPLRPRMATSSPSATARSASRSTCRSSPPSE